jgi:galactose mutarotase-like enzyme
MAACSLRVVASRCRSRRHRLGLRLGHDYRFVQVFAPPGSDFICFEPKTAPVSPFQSERTVLAKPGTSYIARFEIRDDRG